MPKDTFALPIGDWVLVTSNDVTAVRVQNLGSTDIFMMAMESEVEPTDIKGAVVITPKSIVDAGWPLSEFFPYIVLARVYLMSPYGGQASVAHA